MVAGQLYQIKLVAYFVGLCVLAGGPGIESTGNIVLRSTSSLTPTELD